MAIKSFFVQDGLNVNNYIIANTTVLAVGSNLTVNATTVNINAAGLWANSSLGTNGQYLASNGTSTYWATVSAGSVNTAAQYTWTNTHTFNANVTLGTSAALIANGSAGTNGQVLTSNGTSTYWASAAAGVNTAAQYTWTNTHTFNSNVTHGTSSALIANSSAGTNGQYLASNGTTVYWATPTASATAGGPNTAVQFANGTAIAGNGNFTFNYSTGQVVIGSGGYAYDSDSLLVVKSAAVNGYVEIAIQNANTGNNSSADLIAYADTANDTIDYIDMGMNGSNYNQTAYSIVGAKDGYFYTSNGHLAIGTAANKEIRFHAGGTTANNEIMSINSTAVQISSNVTVYSAPIMSTIMTALGYAWF